MSTTTVRRSNRLRKLNDFKNFETKIPNKIKKLYNNHNNISFIVEEYSEDEHKFSLESDNDEEHSNNSQQNLEIKNTAFSVPSKAIAINSLKNVDVSNIYTLNCKLQKNTEETTISSSLEEDATSYFNLVTKKEQIMMEEDGDYVIV